MAGSTTLEPGLAVRRAALARATLAAKRNPASASDVEDLRREYAAAKLADFIERTVASAPTLTQEQRDRLTLLLQVPARRGGVAA